MASAIHAAICAASFGFRPAAPGRPSAGDNWETRRRQRRDMRAGAATIRFWSAHNSARRRRPKGRPTHPVGRLPKMKSIHHAATYEPAEADKMWSPAAGQPATPARPRPPIGGLWERRENVMRRDVNGLCHVGRVSAVDSAL